MNISLWSQNWFFLSILPFTKILHHRRERHCRHWIKITYAARIYLDRRLLYTAALETIFYTMPRMITQRRQLLIARNQKPTSTQGLSIGQKSQEQNAHFLPSSRRERNPAIALKCTHHTSATFVKSTRLFLADEEEEEDDHVDRLNQIVDLANLHNKLLGLSLIPDQQPTYERMLLIPSAPQEEASEAVKAEETAESPPDAVHKELPDAGDDDETADFPPDAVHEELPDARDGDDEVEESASAIKPFLFPAVHMCPFVAKGLCDHAGYTTQRGLSTHCRMRHKDENGKPIILTTVEEDPLEDGTVYPPAQASPICSKLGEARKAGRATTLVDVLAETAITGGSSGTAHSRLCDPSYIKKMCPHGR